MGGDAYSLSSDRNPMQSLRKQIGAEHLAGRGCALDRAGREAIDWTKKCRTERHEWRITAREKYVCFPRLRAALINEAFELFSI